LLFATSGLGALASCGNTDYGDQPTQAFIPPPAGSGNSIRDIADPASKVKADDKTDVSVTGAIVVAVDNYDETLNGKSSGTIYVADLGSKLPYSGISLFQPTFVPADLKPGPGDTLDLAGQYQKNQTLPVPFATGATLDQIAKPVATFRFEANVTAPVDVDINELADYDKGRKWLNMLIRVQNVTLQRDAIAANAGARVSSTLLPDTGTGAKCTDPFPKAPALVNELMDLNPLQLKQGTVIKSLVGVVTFFCNLHIAPRTAADVQL
jgi:hypothetical protein